MALHDNQIRDRFRGYAGQTSMNRLRLEADAGARGLQTSRMNRRPQKGCFADCHAYPRSAVGRHSSPSAYTSSAGHKLGFGGAAMACHGRTFARMSQCICSIPTSFGSSLGRSWLRMDAHVMYLTQTWFRCVAKTLVGSTIARMPRRDICWTQTSFHRAARAVLGGPRQRIRAHVVDFDCYLTRTSFQRSAASSTPDPPAGRPAHVGQEPPRPTLSRVHP